MLRQAIPGMCRSRLQSALAAAAAAAAAASTAVMLLLFVPSKGANSKMCIAVLLVHGLAFRALFAKAAEREAPVSTDCGDVLSQFALCVNVEGAVIRSLARQRRVELHQTNKQEGAVTSHGLPINV
eukprot:224030-Amphidinium_carterae.3